MCVCVCDLLPKDKHIMEHFQHVQHSSVLVEKKTPCHVDTKCVLYATGSTFPPGLDFSKTTCILYSLPLPEQFEIQKLRIYCDPEQNNRETACEIPGVVSTRLLDVSVLAHSNKFHLLMSYQIRSDLIFEIFHLITRPFFKKSLKTDK